MDSTSSKPAPSRKIIRPDKATPEEILLAILNQ